MTRPNQAEQSGPLPFERTDTKTPLLSIMGVEVTPEDLESLQEQLDGVTAAEHLAHQITQDIILREAS